MKQSIIRKLSIMHKIFASRHLYVAAFGALVVCSQPTSACYIGEASHNMYMMNVFNKQCVADMPYRPDFSSFWINYTGSKPGPGEALTYYSTHIKEIQRTARNKADRELITYMQVLDNYLKQAHAFDNTWDYPTKAQLLQRQQQLQKILATAKQYRGNRLRAQYDLLRMRCNIILKKHTDNILFWQQTARMLPASPYRDLMYNIYAGALLYSGKRHDALQIYAQQEDWQSVHTALYRYLNLTGIKQLYQEDANAAPLPYMVQYFVNSAQETLDAKRKENNRIGMPVYHETTPQEVNDFIAFATQVVSNGKSRTPILWQTAIGMLQYLYQQENVLQTKNTKAMQTKTNALQTMDKAILMDGTVAMKNCARCIRLLCSVAPARMDANYCHYLRKEFDWLSTEKMGYYSNVIDRVVYQELIPKYRRTNRPEMVTALLADIKGPFWPERPTPHRSYDYTDGMNNLFVSHIDTLSADEIIRDVKFMKSSSGNEFENWVLQHSFLNDNYYNDNIGTHLLAEGRFAQATTYLKQVPVSYLRQQSTAWYMAHRQWHLAPWFIKQHNAEDYWDYNTKQWVRTNLKGKEHFVKATAEEGKLADDARDQLHATLELRQLDTNRKLLFATEMNKMEATYAIANDTLRQQLAYQLAVRYAQASYFGDCWWLTNRGKSCTDTLRPKTKDFLSTALKYLEVSAQSQSFKMQEQSIYAQAWIPAEPWYESRYTYTDDSGRQQVYIDRSAFRFTYPQDMDPSQLVIHSQSSQYFHLLRLSQFAATHARQIDTYITKCDVLQQFRKIQKQS